MKWPDSKILSGPRSRRRAHRAGWRAVAAGGRSARPAADAHTEEVGQRELRGAGMPFRWTKFAAELAPIGRVPASMLTTGRCRWQCWGHGISAAANTAIILRPTFCRTSASAPSRPPHFIQKNCAYFHLQSSLRLIPTVVSLNLPDLRL